MNKAAAAAVNNANLNGNNQASSVGNSNHSLNNILLGAGNGPQQ
jgi:hypothetical protein